jgi:hypothetical protein
MDVCAWGNDYSRGVYRPNYANMTLSHEISRAVITANCSYKHYSVLYMHGATE